MWMLKTFCPEEESDGSSNGFCKDEAIRMFITVLFIIMEITSHLRTLLDFIHEPIFIKWNMGPYKHGKVGTVSLSQDGWWAGLADTENSL